MVASLRVCESPKNDDSTLIGLAQAGDRRALDALLRRHRGSIERLCRRSCVDPSQADDVIQETYIAVLRNLGSFRNDSSFLTWVYTIARTHGGRASRTAIRDQGRRERLLHHTTVLEPRRVAPDDEVASHEIKLALDGALAPLSPVDRSIALMRDLEGCSAAEVANHLGLTVPAVKTRLHRARLAVRKRLGEAHVALACAV